MTTELIQEDFDALAEFLSSDNADDALDIIETHGFMCGLVAAPTDTDEQLWKDVLLGEEVKFSSKEQEQKINQSLLALYEEVKRSIELNEKIEIPCDLKIDLDSEDSDLQNWCIGFMESIFINEDQWFEFNDQERLVEMLLPVTTLSGLFEDDPHTAEVFDNPKIRQQLCKEVPQSVIDLFLFFHAA